MAEDRIQTFPRPWRITRTQGGHYKIEDGNGRGLAYVYARNEPGLRDSYLQEADALAMAQAIARLSLGAGGASE
jgi:hypothetical protein